MDTGEVVGTHDGIHQWTLGQRCNIGGQSDAFFVAKKRPKTNTIYVVSLVFVCPEFKKVSHSIIR